MTGSQSVAFYSLEQVVSDVNRNYILSTLDRLLKAGMLNLHRARDAALQTRRP